MGASRPARWASRNTTATVRPVRCGGRGPHRQTDAGRCPTFFPDPDDPAGSPLANADGDPLLNVFELAFGKNPLVNDSGEIPFRVEINDDGFVVLSVVRPVGVEGIRYSFEVAGSLGGPWQWSGGLDRLQWATNHGDGTETFHVLLEDIDPLLERDFFVRLRVDLGVDPLD